MDSERESCDEGPSESMTIKSPQKLMKVEIIGRKRKIVADETPRRAPPPLNKKPKDAGEGSSSKPKLDKKLEKLKPYFEKYEALPEVIESFNKNKDHISNDFIDTIIQSCDGGECVAAHKSYEGLSPNNKRKNRNYINMLIRVRYGMGFAKAGKKKCEEYSNVPECNLGETCLYHFMFKEDNSRPADRVIGGHTFTFHHVAWEGGRNMQDYWCCKNCQHLKKKVQDKHKSKVNGQEVAKLSYGYLRMNAVTGQLEDPKQKGRKVDPQQPGGLPHICGKKPELDHELKIEATSASISNAKERIKNNVKEIEESVESLIRELDAEKTSETLKKFMDKYNNAFKYDKKHRKYFLYFITFDGSDEILYFGITCNPKKRLYEHKIGKMFKVECDSGTVLHMHLMPIGNINLLLAADIETLLIRLSKAGNLSSCNFNLIRNESNGRYSSKRKFARKIVEKKGAGFNDIITSLNELIAHTFDHGVTISSNDTTRNIYNTTSDTKKRLSFHQKVLKTLTDTTQKKLEAITPESINKKKFPDELLAHVHEWQETFKKSDDEQQYFLYFFTYANERQAIYYGISATPYDRRDYHENDPNSPLFELFKGPKKLDMYLVPLGDTNLMMAAEVETCFIRLSKAGFINDGNIALNPSDGIFSSTFEACEEYLIAESGEKFEKLVLVMNQIFAATLAAKRLVT